MKTFLQTEPSFLKLFSFIFFFNAISLLVNIVSGIGVILPYLFSFFIGLNVGIIGYFEGGKKALFGMFVAPHVIFELPAAWISTTLGMQIARELLINYNDFFLITRQSIQLYTQFILPLLLIAGIIEAALISFMMKQSKHTAALADEPLDT